ncbi:MAG: 3-phosphoshikimate 1-carboxyvinyltransferase [Verrucomicrobiota bacterium]|nr:3-phosphoshikimate 1-carboxyvinyltransferase [Verrucomicrobiota bacterium]
MNQLPIVPFTEPARGTVAVPGSKSITNRAMILAALCDGAVRLEGALFSRDTKIMAASLRLLGFMVDESPASADGPENSITVHGQGGTIPVAEAALHVGNAGTAARFLTAFLALREGGRYTLDGDEAMRRRPMAGLLEALGQLGATFTFHAQPGCFPFTMQTRGLPGGRVTLDASASSQLLSALLMVAPHAREALTIELQGETVSEPFVEMTLRMIQQFGVHTVVRTADGVYTCHEPARYSLPGVIYQIEPDASAASYFLMLPGLVGGELTVNGLRRESLQGDINFIDVLRTIGVEVTETACGICAKGVSTLHAGAFDFNAISDTFLTLAAAAPLLTGQTVITGIAHTRKQETDRIHAMATELAKLAQRAEETPDSLAVTPDAAELRRIGREGRATGHLATVHTYEDHRVAMSFGILGSVDILGDGAPWLAIEDPDCTGKTFPRFFQTLEQVRANSGSYGITRTEESNVASYKTVRPPAFIIVAVDGGAATGKSSTSRAVAERMNLLHVDTGSHYRAVTLLCLEAGLSAESPAAIARHLETIKLETQVHGRRAMIRIGGKVPAADALRSQEVNANVSLFAALPEVRQAVFHYQRSQADVAREHGFAGLIMEGRDIGTIIFPEATFKFYLDADTAIRSARRAGEGQQDTIAARDRIDSTRKTAPLTHAPGAILIDTARHNLDDVVDMVCTIIETEKGR